MYICASINGLDNSIYNSNIAILSMESIKWIINLHNNYHFTSYSVVIKYVCYLTPEILQLVANSKPNVANVTTIVQ